MTPLVPDDVQQRTPRSDSGNPRSQDQGNFNQNNQTRGNQKFMTTLIDRTTGLPVEGLSAEHLTKSRNAVNPSWKTNPGKSVPDALVLALVGAYKHPLPTLKAMLIPTLTFFAIVGFVGGILRGGVVALSGSTVKASNTDFTKSDQAGSYLGAKAVNFMLPVGQTAAQAAGATLVEFTEKDTELKERVSDYNPDSPFKSPSDKDVLTINWEESK